MNLDGIIKNLPSKETPLFKATFEKMCNAILEVAFPVGKTEIFYDNDDHSNYLGFTWQRDAEGQAIVGISQDDEDFNEIGKTLGEKKHKMTVDELVAHSHSIAPNVSLDKGGSLYSTEFTINGLDDWSKLHTNSTGGGQPFNIIQPSKVFAIWRRVA